MNLTTDQYYGLAKLIRWYDKYKNQFIEVSGVIGTGVWDIIQEFIQHTELDSRNVMYLSYDQKQVLELAAKKYHAYYLDGILYKYSKIVDFNTLSVITPSSREMKYEWKKELKTKIDEKYKLMIVFDSSLLNYKTIKDLSTFGLPIILIKDPMLLPAPDSYRFSIDPDIELNEISEKYIKHPIIHFTHRILNNEKLIIGNYDNVSIISRKQMNLYNLKSANMNIVLTDELRNEINMIYREKILKRKDIITLPNERTIVMETMYNHKIVNKDENKIKIYLTKGTIGTISKINKHAMNTKWVPGEFLPEFYHEAFPELVIDRHYLNKINLPSYQIIPDEPIKLEYAYALTPMLCRLSHWNKVTLILNDVDASMDIYKKILYTAFTRAKNFLTIVL